MKKKLLISASVVVLLGGAVMMSGYAVRPTANQFIRQNGFPEASISNLTMTPTGVMIDHISLDSNEFSTLDNVILTFNWIDFLKTGKLEALSIKDISLTCELDETGSFKIAGWDATLPQSSGGSSLIPIQSLLLQGITLDVATPQGDIRIEGKVTVDTPDATTQTLQYAVWGQQHQLSFDAKGTGKLSANGDISLSTTLNEGRINLPDIELSRASGWVDYAHNSAHPASSFSGQLVAGKVNTLGALLQNVTITLDTTKPESVFFKTSPAGHDGITLTGRWMTLPENKLEFLVNSASTLELVEFISPDKVEDLKPWLGNANPLALTISAPLSALQADKKKADISLRLGGDKSSVILSSEGTAVYDSASGEPPLDAQKTSLQVAKGQIDVSPFSFVSSHAGTPPLNLSLTFKNIDMNTLSQMADIDGLKADGVLSGSIPLIYSDKGVTFGQGIIKSDGAGIFAYKPDSFPPSLQGDDSRMQTVREALSNFHFKSLSAEISGPLSGKMKTTLKAEGTNPVFGDRPINLNLNLDGDLGTVIEQTLQAGDIGGKIGSHISGAKKK